MKALIIAEDDSTIQTISPIIKSCGYDTIVYHWLLKALDNVEEIVPDMVLISTAEYPRHWKTFVQFAQSGIGGVVPKIILYNSHNFTEEDSNKAKTLGVYGTFSSLDKNGLSTLKSFLSAKSDSALGDIDSPKIEFVFTNPHSKTLVTGTVEIFTGKKMEFVPDIKDFIKDLQVGDVIKKATLGRNKSYEQVGAKVFGIKNDVLELNIA